MTYHCFVNDFLAAILPISTVLQESLGKIELLFNQNADLVHGDLLIVLEQGLGLDSQLLLNGLVRGLRHRRDRLKTAENFRPMYSLNWTIRKSERLC